MGALDPLRGAFVTMDYAMTGVGERTMGWRRSTQGDCIANRVSYEVTLERMGGSPHGSPARASEQAND